MSVRELLLGGATAALAVVIAAAALPGAASAREEGEERTALQIRGERIQQGNAQREERRAQQAEQRAQQAEQRSEWRAQQPDRGIDQRAAPAEGRGEQRAEQRDRQGDRAAWRVANRGDRQGSRPAESGVDQAARQGDQRGGEVSRQAGENDRWRTERNRSYADLSRNGSYTTDRTDRRDGDRRGDNTWQGDRRADTNWSNDRGRDGDRRWDRNWRHNDRYDWQRYRNSHRQAYNLGAYYSPYRYYTYRRFGVGGYLNSQFFGSSYWITNPWQYRLPDVWGPYRWVRYYDDVMLVDIYTGQVVDVIYNFFW